MANKAQKIVETRQEVGDRIAEQVSVETMRETVEQLFATNTQLQESLSNVAVMFAREDQGWLKLGDLGEDQRGLSLDDLKKWSKEIREAIAGNPHIKRGARLRISNVWDGGISYSNIPNEGRGGGKNVQAKIDLPINQKYFFGSAAREERETALYSDSLVIYIGTDATKTIEPIALDEITADYRNPDNAAEIWAFRRAWNSYRPAKDGKPAEPVPMVRWYYTDTFKDKAVTHLVNGAGEREVVDKTKTIFDGSVNTQIGWAYGVPDALSALVWARLYKDFLVNGKVMSDALATFAFKASVTSKGGADNASMKVAGATGAGNTAVVGATNDLVPMSSAGKVYDFDGGRPLLSVVATAIEVSVIALSSDPGTAGSSYGSASTLDLPTRLAIKSRRQWHIDFDTRVLRWMGALEAKVSFDPMEEATDIFRKIQAVLLFWSSGLMHPAEARKEMLELLDVVGVSVTPPTGVMVPNNTASLARPDVDTDGQTVNATPKGGQGQNSPAGKGVNANDLRTDGLGEMMALLEKFVASEDRLREERAAA